jgi:hypothetical protein
MLLTLCLFSYGSYNDIVSSRRMYGRRIVNNELLVEKMREELSWPNLKYDTGSCLERLMNITKNLTRNCRYLNRYLNRDFLNASLKC